MQTNGQAGEVGIMDSIAALADVIGHAVAKSQQQARAVTGQYRGGDVMVGGSGYRPVNAGDTYPVDGKPVYCVVDGENCYVVSDK